VNQQFRYRQFQAGNPLANILVVIVGILFISLALTLGFFVFLGIAGLVLFMGVVMTIRGWWYRRKFRATQGDEAPDQTRVHETHQIIEGEYQEVRTRQKTRDDG